MAERVVTIKLQADASGVVSGFGTAQAAAGELQSRVSDSASKITLAARSQRAEWATVGAGLTAVGAAVTGVGLAAMKTGIEYNTLQQTSRAAMTTLLGSATAANAQMDKLNEFARSSPFSKGMFIQAQQQMLAFGIETKKVLPYLDALQNAVAAAGGSNQQISELSFIMAQISAAGKITAQDLMQFGQRGVNAAELIGSQMGKTGAQIREDISKGALDANQALDALAAGMSSKYAGAAASVKETFSGAMDRVKAAWRDFSAELAKPLVDPNGGGALVDLLNWTADVMRGFQNLPEPVKMTASALTGLVGVAALVGGAGMLILPKWLEFTSAMKTLGVNAELAKSSMTRFASFATGPWGVAIAAAIAVVGVLVNEKQKLVDQAEQLAGTLDQETGAVSKNSTAWAANELQKEGVLSSAKRLGISAKDMTDAWLGNAAALERVNGQLDKWVKDSDFRMENADWKGWSDDIAGVQYALEGSNTVLSEAKKKHDELAEATGESGGQAKSAAEKYQEQAGAARAATDELKQLLEVLNESNSAGQSAEQANAAYQKSIADVEEYIRKANEGVEGYTLSLDANTEAGSANRAMLADHAAKAWDAAEKQSRLDASTVGTAKAVDNFQAALGRSREKLIAEAKQLGANQKEAEAYADRILKIPTRHDLKAIVEKNDAEAKIKAYKDSLGSISRSVTTVLSVIEQTFPAPKKAGKAYGGTVGFAHGGTVPGIGGAVVGGTVYGVGGTKSDSITVNLSRGEEVIQEPFASRYRSELKRMNRGDFAPSSMTSQRQVVVVREIGDVYVQNPVTGKYLLTQMGDVANQAIDSFAAQSANAMRRNGI